MLGLGLSLTSPAVLRTGAGGGGVNPATIYDYFADNAGTWPWYGDTHEPAVYFADTNTTWIASETSFSNKRYTQVQVLNHTTGEMSQPYFAGINNALTDDDHGVPSICRDSQGYVYVFYGSHGGNQLYAVTNSPNDPSAWTEKTALTGFWTYPTPDPIGADLYLWLRGGTAGGGDATQKEYGYFKAPNVTGGNPVWDAFVTVVDFGELPTGFTSRFYNGNHITIGDETFIVAAQADNGNTYTRDAFVFARNNATGAVRNLQNTVSTPAGSLPISIATARASYRIVDHTTSGRYGTRPSMALDASGNLHFIYGDSATNSAFTMLHRVWNGTTLSSPETIGTSTDNHTDRSTIVARGDDIDAYWFTPGATAYIQGGDLSTRTRSAAGAWGATSVVKAAGSTYPLNGVTTVTNGHANARIIFSETVKREDWASNEAIALKRYAYGDAGFVTRPKPESERGFQPLDYFGANVIAWWDLQTQGRLLTRSDTAMQWQDRARGNLLTQSTAAMKPAYSATGWDGALPALTGDGLGPASTGDVLAGTGPYAATQSIFIVAERGTQNTETNTTLRSLYKTAIASGNSVGYLTLLRPSADAGQTIYQVQGAGTGNVTVVSPTSFGIGAKAVLFGQIQSADTRAAANSGTLSSAGALGATTSTNTSLFGDSALTTGQRFGGKIVEVLIIDRVLTTQEYQYVSAYLAWKWGIQTNLDASNPFKETRPPALAA